MKKSFKRKLASILMAGAMLSAVAVPASAASLPDMNVVKAVVTPVPGSVTTRGIANSARRVTGGSLEMAHSAGYLATSAARKVANDAVSKARYAAYSAVNTAENVARTAARTAVDVGLSAVTGSIN